MGREKHIIDLQYCINLIILMKTVSKEKTDKKLDIFERAQQIKREQEAEQAAKIMNAYRRVQDIKVRDAIKKPEKKVSYKKPQSQYANKVKQTLKQLNANKHKEQKQIKSKNIEFKQERSQAERHLMSSSCKKIFKLLMKKMEGKFRQSFEKMKASACQQSDEIEELIRIWRLKRIFCAWNYEAMLSKIEAARIAKQRAQKLQRSLRLADDFRYFSLMKKTIKFWSIYTKKMVRKREAEEEQRKIQIAEILQQKNAVSSPKRSQVQKNHQLQNKLRGFLDNLKHQIDGKQRRLHTIKEKTEDSQMQMRSAQNHETLQEVQPQNHENQNEQEERQEHPQESQRNEESPSRESRNNGPLSNQQLQKRRKEIADKAKNRKQALERLKKEKEQQKKKEEEERLKIEKEIEEEQKKARQQQYRKFLKQKKQLEQWEQKQRQLNNMANQFNKIRMVKYYGWVQWKKLKQTKKEHCEQIANVLLKMVLKRKLHQFVEKVEQLGGKRLIEIEQKMKVIHTRKLLRKCIIGFKYERDQQKQLKQEFQVRHEVHTLKIFFRSWMRARSDLQLQNFQWERPRVKRAECLHGMTLMEKAMKALKVNQEEEIQNRNIKEHKERIRQKIQNIVEQQPTIDYDQFL